MGANGNHDCTSLDMMAPQFMFWKSSFILGIQNVWTRHNFSFNFLLHLLNHFQNVSVFTK